MSKHTDVKTSSRMPVSPPLSRSLSLTLCQVSVSICLSPPLSLSPFSPPLSLSPSLIYTPSLPFFFPLSQSPPLFTLPPSLPPSLFPPSLPPPTPPLPPSRVLSPSLLSPSHPLSLSCFFAFWLSCSLFFFSLPACFLSFGPQPFNPISLSPFFAPSPLEYMITFFLIFSEPLCSPELYALLLCLTYQSSVNCPCTHMAGG